MYKTGHIGAALLAYAPLGRYLLEHSATAAVLGGTGALALASVPDVDESVPGLPHRGPTHSLPFLALVAGGVGAVGWIVARAVPALPGGPMAAATVAALVAIAAIGSHLLVDMLTPMGVNVLWPLPMPVVSLRVTRSDDPVANLLFLAAGLGVSVAVLYAGWPG